MGGGVKGGSVEEMGEGRKGRGTYAVGIDPGGLEPRRGFGRAGRLALVLGWGFLLWRDFET